MPAFVFDSTASLNDVSTTLVDPIDITASAPITVHVASAAVFTALGSGTALLAISPATETVNDPVECFRISAFNAGTNQITLSARSLDGTAAATWAAGSIVSVRTFGLNFKQLQDAVQTLGASEDAAQVQEYLHYKPQFS